MKVMIVFLLLPLMLLGNPIFKFFENQHPELPAGKDITAVYQDPTDPERYFYASFDHLYLSNKGYVTPKLNLSKEIEDQEIDETELNEALEALHDEIYEEEKEEIESELGVDDAEDYYDDLIQERTEDRYQEEAEILKEDFKYLQLNDDKENNTETVQPIGKVTFLQNLSKVVIVETVNGFYLSIKHAPFKLVETEQEKKYDDLILKDTDIPFVSGKKLYLFDSIEENIVPIVLENFRNQNVIDLSDQFPYLLIRTATQIHLLKQEEQQFKLIRSISFETDQRGKLYLFQGNDIYFLKKNGINWFDISDGRNLQIETPYTTLFDLYSKNKVLYLATSKGLMVINPITKTREILSLGLLPERITMISGGDSIYVSNKASLYKLRIIKNLKELKSVKDILMIRARIAKKYPILQELFSLGIQHNFLSHGGFRSMISRSRYASFMPKLYGKYRQTLTSKGSPEEYLIENDTLTLNRYSTDNIDATTTPYFEAYLLFDFSHWIFDNKELSAYQVKDKAREAREDLRNSITYYYNHYILLSVLHELSDNNRDRLTFRLQSMESGAILNGLIGKQLFRGMQ